MKVSTTVLQFVFTCIYLNIFFSFVYIPSLRKRHNFLTLQYEEYSGYIIDVHEQHPKVADKALKHCQSREAYFNKHVVSKHTIASFDGAKAFVNDFFHHSARNDLKCVILDSGCGVGLSTMRLALQNPSIPVIGIDRSLVRLSKNIHTTIVSESSTLRTSLNTFTSSTTPNSESVNSESVKILSDSIDQKDSAFLETKSFLRSCRPRNLYLCRADLTDFWMLAYRESDWIIDSHYLLYPNPYPKPKHLQLRWHG